MRPLALIPILLLATATAAAAQTEDWPYNQAFLPPNGRIGVHIQSMTPDLRQYFGAPPDRGLLVTRVEPHRPAAKGGVGVGDVIVNAGGDVIRQPFDLVRAVGRAPAGKPLALEVVRDGKAMQLSVVPEGDATPWVDPKYWRDWLQEGVRRGGESVQRQLEELERRLEELEKRLEKQERPGTGRQQT